ncbi:PaaI family thioesterase [Pseudalkalibacillus sp. SCS-8]|uniref:PaaI family thioesterase n=1 Tax=Pseudalkalibacillus nanhaiensis TaxID=3115291 RepID=UPI0032DA3142
MDMKNRLMEKLEKVINTSSNVDMEVLDQLLSGLEQKNAGNYTTYITSFMQTSMSVEDDILEMTIPITPFLNNSVDIVHGGFTATLADTAMGTLVNKKIDKNRVAVTAEMKLNYTAPGKGVQLRCKASILHLGSKTAVTEAKIYDEKNTLVAAASGSFYLIPR